MTDPYSILGIARTATDDEVKKAYRAMCRKYHPDKNPGNQAAEEMFKVVQEAYETIMNERKNGSSQANTGSSYSYGGGFYGNQGPSYSGQNSNYYQAAANYLNTRHYAEALNVLNNISDRDAMWYYLSALANAGLGNNYQAQEQARTAAAMEPGNVYYRNLVNQLASGGYAYGNMQQPYGGYSNDCCTNFLCCNLLCNPCCDCDPFCCC